MTTPEFPDGAGEPAEHLRNRRPRLSVWRRQHRLRTNGTAYAYIAFVLAAVVVFVLRRQWMSAAALIAVILFMAALQRIGPDPIQRALGGVLPMVPILAGAATLLLLHPSSVGSQGFYAASATVIPTSLIAIAISGRLLARQLHEGIDLARVSIGLYLIGNGEFSALQALYRGVGTTSDVAATAAGVTASFATVLVAGLVSELAAKPSAQVSAADPAAPKMSR